MGTTKQMIEDAIHHHSYNEHHYNEPNKVCYNDSRHNYKIGILIWMQWLRLKFNHIV